MSTKCPCCSYNLDGVQLSYSNMIFESKLNRIWNEGMLFAVQQDSITKAEVFKKCPYKDELVFRNSWIGGAFHGLCWKKEEPQKVADFLGE